MSIDVVPDCHICLCTCMRSIPDSFGGYNPPKLYPYGRCWDCHCWSNFCPDPKKIKKEDR